MRDSSNEIKAAYITLLDGNLTLNAVDVPVFDTVKANQATPYVYFSEFEFVEDSCKDNFDGTVIMGLTVVTKYTNAVGGVDDSDDIGGQVLALLHNDTYLSTANFDVIVNKLLSNSSSKTATATGTRVTKTIRLEHFISQTGGDLTRITDLTATADGATTIDLAWTNVTGNTGYRIERSLDCATWALVTTVAQDVVVYSDTGLTTNTIYHYRVRAFDASGGSGWSNIASDMPVSTVTPSGIAYNRPTTTGATTSYRTGDDVWNATNDPYPDAPVYPVSYARLDYGHASPLLNLVSNNAFGNKDRFTDDLGLQTYTNPYIIDHYTGLGWYKTRQSNNFSDACDNAQASVLLGFTDWRFNNQIELQSIFNEVSANRLNYAPFSHSQANWHCSTTGISDNTLCYTFENAGLGRWLTVAKTTNRNWLFVRNHY